jgi:hypothetical protein
MRRLLIIAPCALALLALAGCQSEEEKRAEREKLKSELRSEIISELNGMVSSEVRVQLQQAIDDHKRKLAEQAAAAKAAAAKPAPAPAKKK